MGRNQDKDNPEPIKKKNPKAARSSTPKAGSKPKASSKEKKSAPSKSRSPKEKKSTPVKSKKAPSSKTKKTAAQKPRVSKKPSMKKIQSQKSDSTVFKKSPSTQSEKQKVLIELVKNSSTNEYTENFARTTPSTTEAIQRAPVRPGASQKTGARIPSPPPQNSRPSSQKPKEIRKQEARRNFLPSAPPMQQKPKEGPKRTFAEVYKTKKKDKKNRFKENKPSRPSLHFNPDALNQGRKEHKRPDHPKKPKDSFRPSNRPGGHLNIP